MVTLIVNGNSFYFYISVSRFQPFFKLSKELATSKPILLPWSAITRTTILGGVPVKGSRCSPRTILALIIGLFNWILNDYSSLFRSVSSALPSPSISIPLRITDRGYLICQEYLSSVYRRLYPLRRNTVDLRLTEFLSN